MVEIKEIIGRFDRSGLVYPWTNVDPRVDNLQQDITDLVTSQQDAGRSHSEIFDELWEIAHSAAGQVAPSLPEPVQGIATVPYLTEPWYC